MLGQFSDFSVQAKSTNYHPKLLKTKADISFFYDVLSDIKALEKQKETVAEKASTNIHIQLTL